MKVIFYKAALIINLMMIINFNNYSASYILGIDISALNEKKQQPSTSILCLRGNKRTRYHISDAPPVRFRYVEEL